MNEIVRVSAETPPNFTGVEETPAVCMGVAEMLSVFTGEAETPPDHNTVAGTFSL